MGRSASLKPQERIVFGISMFYLRVVYLSTHDIVAHSGAIPTYILF
jgi:hypothetical protein